MQWGLLFLPRWHPHCGWLYPGTMNHNKPLLKVPFVGDCIISTSTDMLSVHYILKIPVGEVCVWMTSETRVLGSLLFHRTHFGSGCWLWFHHHQNGIVFLISSLAVHTISEPGDSLSIVSKCSKKGKTQAEARRCHFVHWSIDLFCVSVSSGFELSLLGWMEIHKSFPKSMWKLKDVSGALPPAEKKKWGRRDSSVELSESQVPEMPLSWVLTHTGVSLSFDLTD